MWCSSQNILYQAISLQEADFDDFTERVTIRSLLKSVIPSVSHPECSSLQTMFILLIYILQCSFLLIVPDRVPFSPPSSSPSPGMSSYDKSLLTLPFSLFWKFLFIRHWLFLFLLVSYFYLFTFLLEDFYFYLLNLLLFFIILLYI